jgi:hypothetical protein
LLRRSAPLNDRDGIVIARLSEGKPWQSRRDSFVINRIYVYSFLLGYFPSTSFMDSFSNFFLKLLDYESAREILNYTIYPFFPNTFKELDIHFKNLYPSQQ